jgi:peptide/nickel transport system substrate-binding protein
MKQLTLQRVLLRVWWCSIDALKRKNSQSFLTESVRRDHSGRQGDAVWIKKDQDNTVVIPNNPERRYTRDPDEERRKTMRRQHFGYFFAACLVCLWITSLFSFAFASEPRYGGTLRVGVLIPQFNRLDSRYVTIGLFDPTAEMIYDGLLQWGEKYEKPAPMLATSYETKDNRVWVFHLRKGVKFHNGREMTAEDVKTNIDWFIETPKGWKPVQRKGSFEDLEKVEVIDRYTLKITLKRPFAPFPRILATNMRAIVPPEEVEKWGDKFTFHPVGTGAFKALNIKEDKVILERFEDYWGPKPYLDRVEYIFIRSDESRLIGLQKGEIDITYLFDDAKPILEKDPNIAYVQILIPDSHVKISFNFRRWPMSDIRFRKAVWMGADWKNLTINAYPFKSGNPTRTFFEHTRYFNPEALKLVPSHNPEEAKRLIQTVEKDAGKKIPPIYWLDNDATDRKVMGEMAKIQLGQIGVPLNLQILPRGIFTDKLSRDPKIEWDMAQIGIGFGLDPYVGLIYFMTNSGYGADGKSLPGYSNPEFDRWLQKAVEAMEEGGRIKCYQEAEKVLLKDVVAVPWYPTRVLMAYNKKVKGARYSGQAAILIARDWVNTWLEK